jgi:hypothetical protein
MLMPLLIAACMIDAAAALFLLWQIAKLGPRFHGVREMLVPFGILALTLFRAAQYYHAGHPVKALLAASWPTVLIGGGYALIFLVCLIAKPRWI